MKTLNVTLFAMVLVISCFCGGDRQNNQLEPHQKQPGSLELSDIEWQETPIVYYIDSSVSDQQVMAIFEVAQKTNADLGAEVLKVEGRTSDLDSPTFNGKTISASDSYNGIYFLDAQFFNEESGGVTSIQYNKDFVVEADIFINSSSYGDVMSMSQLNMFKDLLQQRFLDSFKK